MRLFIICFLTLISFNLAAQWQFGPATDIGFFGLSNYYHEEEHEIDGDITASKIISYNRKYKQAYNFGIYSSYCFNDYFGLGFEFLYSYTKAELITEDVARIKQGIYHYISHLAMYNGYYRIEASWINIPFYAQFSTNNFSFFAGVNYSINISGQYDMNKALSYSKSSHNSDNISLIMESKGDFAKDLSYLGPIIGVNLKITDRLAIQYSFRALKPLNNKDSDDILESLSLQQIQVGLRFNVLPLKK